MPIDPMIPPMSYDVSGYCGIVWAFPALAEKLVFATGHFQHPLTVSVHNPFQFVSVQHQEVNEAGYFDHEELSVMRCGVMVEECPKACTSG